MHNDIALAFSFISSTLDILPKILSTVNSLEEIEREYQEKQALRHSEKEYLNSIYSLFKSGKISSLEAQKAVNLIFKNKPKSIDTVAIEADIMRLIKGC